MNRLFVIAFAAANLSLGCVEVLAEANARLEPVSPDSFYVRVDEPARLEWKVLAEAKGVPHEYRVTDYAGRVVAQGRAEPSDGLVAVTLQAARGYYEVEVWGEPFGLIAMEPFAGEPDPFFGMDAVLTWLDRRPAMREAMIRGMKRSGIGIARERINWSAIETQPGQWDWNAKDQAWDLRQLYERAGMPVLEMFHSAGPARGEFPVKNGYPQNLALFIKSWPQIYRQFRSTWAGLEVWNEPEGSGYGSGLPADQYSLLVKAMRYSWWANGIDSPLGGGVFMGGDPGVFHRFCALNGMLQAADFVSIHDYKPATKMERLVAVHREWLKANGSEGMPLWITESGWAWPKGGGRPTFAQDQESALEIAMKGVEAKACGVARYMPFCLAFYEENGAKSFSVMGKEVTPLRAMGAYAQAIRVLAHKRYAGDLPAADPSILRARVFEDQGSADRVAVIYSGEAREGCELAIPGKVLRAEGIDGRSLAVTGEGRVPAPDGMAYVWIEAPPVNPETGAVALQKAAALPFERKAEPAPILLQFLPDPAAGSYSSTRYMINRETASAMPVRVRVHNLSNAAEIVSLTASLPGAATPVDEQKVEVSGDGTAEAFWRIDVRPLRAHPEPVALTVTGSTASGAAVSPLGIPIVVEADLAGYLPLFPFKERLPVANLAQWSPNYSAGAEPSLELGPEKTWKMTVSFQGGDRWVYPTFSLEPGVLGQADGFLLRARVQETADVRMAIYEKGKGAYITFDPLIPSDGQWHVVYVPLDGFEPNQDALNKSSGSMDPVRITAVSVGMNDRSKDRKNTLEVSDLIVVGKKAPK